MRRHEKEVKDLKEIEEYIQRAEICRLGMCADNQPYIVPLNFGYDKGTFYFHSAKEGKKIDLLKVNPHVCFEIEVDTELVRAEQACDYGMRFVSIMGTGKIEFITDSEEQKKALDILMKQFDGEKKWTYSESVMNRIVVYKLQIAEMTCKKSGY